MHPMPTPATRIPAAALALLAAAALAACASEAAPTPTPTPTPFPPPELTEPPLAVLTGTGSGEQSLELEEGVYVLDMSVSGNVDCERRPCRDRRFRVTVSENQAWSVRVANEIAGEWAGRSVIFVGDDGRELHPGDVPFTVEAESAAEWTIAVHSGAAWPGAPGPATLSGRGQDVRFVNLERGIYVVEMSVTGNVDESSAGDCTHWRIEDCSLHEEFSVGAGSHKGHRWMGIEYGPEWSGRSAILVDHYSDSSTESIPPGKTPFAIEAESGAEWTVAIRPAAEFRAAPAPATVSGRGRDMRLIEIEPGAHILDFSIEDNFYCPSDACEEGLFRVIPLVVDAAVVSERLSIDGRTSSWSGRALLELSEERSGDTPASTIEVALDVIAQPTSAWTIDVQPVPDVDVGPPPATLTGTGRDARPVDLPAGVYLVEARVAGNEFCHGESCAASAFRVSIGTSAGRDETPVDVLAADWSGASVIIVDDNTYTVDGPDGHVNPIDFEGPTPGRNYVAVDAAAHGRWEIDIRPLPADASASPPAMLRGSGSDVRLVQLTPGTYDLDIDVAGNDDCRPVSCDDAFRIVARGGPGGPQILAIATAEEWSGAATIEIGYGDEQTPPGVVPLQVTAAPSAAWEMSIARRDPAHVPAKSTPAVDAPIISDDPIPVPATLTGAEIQAVLVLDFAPGRYVVEARIADEAPCLEMYCYGTFGIFIGEPPGGTEAFTDSYIGDWRVRRIIDVGDSPGSIPPGRNRFVVLTHGAVHWMVDIRLLPDTPDADAPATVRGRGEDVRFVRFAPGTYDVAMTVGANKHCGYDPCLPFYFFVTPDDGDSDAEDLVSHIASHWSVGATLEIGDGPGQLPPGIIPLQMRAVHSAKWELAFTRR